jgi:hypothetical protein
MSTFAIYDREQQTSVYTFLPQIARFLIGDHASITGPTSPHIIIDTYSSAAASPHEVPSDSADMDSLAADNGWRTGTLVVGDYIILQSADALRPYQIGIELQGTTSLRIKFSPRAGFDTGNDDNDMNAAGNWTNPVITYFDYSIPSGSPYWSLMCSNNGNAVHMISENGSNYYFTSWGKFENAATTDLYPYAIFTSETACHGNSTSSGVHADDWKRISEVSNTEIACQAFIDSFSISTTENYRKNLDANYVPNIVELCGDVAGNRDYLGIIDNLKVLPSLAGIIGVENNDDNTLLYISSSSTLGALVLPWTGTAYLSS